ncbi:MAG: double-strand break repair protein AddB, partial [Alphaproteobacteria bacterium]
AVRAALIGWVARLGAMAQRFFVLAAAEEAPVGALIAAHVEFAEALADSDGAPGPARLWRRDDGEAAADFVAELAEAARDFPPIRPAHYPGLIDALLAGRVVRPRFGDHPRLSIWGPLEARLQQPDLLILGGLNEGTWPAEPAPDPWMSRPMRQRFGLPAPERRIGLAAHDFAQALAAPRVALTRAERVDGTPTVPSRWLMRLDAVAKGAGLAFDPIRSDAPGAHLAWARALDVPDAVRPCPPPEPRPPVAARPRRLSVTAIGTWMADPYEIYARRILHLKALDPIEADPAAAERGQLIHDALSRFIDDCRASAPDGALPPDALDRLLRHGGETFESVMVYPGVRAFWWPRFRRIAAWVVDRERSRRPDALPLATEVEGGMAVPGPAGPFTLTARADRIDRRADGTLAVIDYKTGTVPTARQIRAGYAPQLPLEALIATAGGFDGVPPATAAELAYWKLSGGDPAGKVQSVKPDEIADLIATTGDGLARLIAEFDDPATPYRSQPRPDFVPHYTDYAHLARVLEWSAGGGAAE